MRTFAEYRAQPDFGCSVEHDYDNWLVAPIGHHRDSDLLTESNWDEVVKALGEANSQAPDSSDLDDPPADDFEVLRFNHWAVGWVEHIIIRPGSKCEDVMTELAARLEDYPVLNEEDFSNREYEDYLESWDNYARKEFVDDLAKEFELSDAVKDRIGDVDSDALREFYSEVAHEPYYHDCGGCVIRTKDAAKYCSRDQLAAFLRAVRKDAPKVAV